jgi:predicted outer membrane repeat protein
MKKDLFYASRTGIFSIQKHFLWISLLCVIPFQKDNHAGHPDQTFPKTIQYDSGWNSGNPCPGGSILYVNDDVASGNDDGSSWANAFNDLQDALALAASCPNVTEIWVAEGTYTPTTCTTCSTTDREVSFVMQNNLAIYGGFPDTGNPTFADRDWAVHETILSGDIDGDDLPFDPAKDDDNDPNTPSQTDHIRGNNAYHVLIGSGADATALLDGFTITAGNADGSFPNNNGGGMYNDNGSPSLANCNFSGNSARVDGGGMRNRGNSSPSLTDCDFMNNSADQRGGGMSLANDSSPSLTGCNFLNNSADEGGGMSIVNASSPTLAHCSFSGNSADQGGGMYIEKSSAAQEVILAHCSFLGNSAREGGGLYTFSTSTYTLTNCSFSGNSASEEGGGMCNRSNEYNSVINCSFTNNTATDGGGVYNTNTDFTNFTNCRFSGNRASKQGGGLFNTQNFVLANCSFSGNRADQEGGGIYSSSNFILPPLINNCIIWNNQDNSGIGTAQASVLNAGTNNIIISHSLIQNLTTDDADGNKDGITNAADANYPAFFTSVDPNTAPTTAGDLRLLPTSPAINMGDNTADLDGPGPNTTTIADIATDLGGNARILQGIIDMGAYEQLSCPGGSILYVNDDVASGNDDGSSWANAFNDLQDALALAASCPNVTEIWVAEGTYTPTTCTTCSTTDREVSFVMQNNLAIYGGFPGFPGQEGDFSARNPALVPTLLSGDIGMPGDDSDNSYHVFFHNGLGLDDSALLDGFTITGGNADGTGSLGSSRDGGGMLNFNSSPSVNNCKFIGNRTAADTGIGGGMNNFESTPRISNCLFFNNSAGQGGAMANISFIASAAVITNCTFASNSADISGDGMLNGFSASPIITNCILWGNGSEIVNINGGNPIVSFSIVQGGYSGTSNLNEDPLFIDPANGNFQLQEGSPAINAGNNTAIPAGLLTDLAGNTRILEDVVDMGAYESRPPIPTMGQWAFFLFGLIIFGIGLVGVYNLKVRVAH